MNSFSIQKPGEGEVTGPIDLDKTTTTLEPDGASGGGLYVPGKDRVVFRPPERKSLLGMSFLFICMCFFCFFNSRRPFFLGFYFSILELGLSCKCIYRIMSKVCFMFYV